MTPSRLSSQDLELSSRVPAEHRGANGIPDPEEVARKERAVAVAVEAAGSLILPAGVRVSPAGPGWSRDIDVHVRAEPDPAGLEAMGWLCLDPLLRRLGEPGQGRWAALEGGRVLAGVDFSTGPPPDPLVSVLARCRRMRAVRAREILELRILTREGVVLPTADPVIAAAARGEAALGGDDLAAWRDGPAAMPPVSLPGARARRLWRLRPSLRPRLVVGLSGVDGSGKSTLARNLVRDLQRANVPASVVWSRPGMGMGMGAFEALARLAKRLMGHGSEPGVRRVAEGEKLSWRRGPVGWLWASVVTLSYVGDVRRQHLRGIGVLVYDRHLPDALVSLDFVYGGTDLRLHRALVKRSVPRAAVAVYVDVTPEVALGRAKANETFKELAVREQLRRYEEVLKEVPGVRTLNGTLASEDLSAELFRLVVGPGA